MKIKELWIEDYKLLKDFNINLDEQLIVLIGQNGSGKSTLLEFVAKRFYDLYEHFVLTKGERPEFDFKLRYEIKYNKNRYEIYITANKKTKEYYEIKIKRNNEKSKKYSRMQVTKEFNNGYKNMLPQNVVMYYSGISETLENKFKSFQRENFINPSIKNSKKIEQPFFYFLPENFSTILIGLLSYQYRVPKILKDQFNIDGFKEIILTLKEPHWKTDTIENMWGVKGDLAMFLVRIKNAIGDNQIEITDKNIIFTIPSQEKLTLIWEFYGEEKSIFEYLTTLQADDLIENIEITINKDGKSISHNDLSEGEKQLLTILGLKELLATENTLFLLDEPDTYLHPKWQRDFVQKVLVQKDTLDSKTSFIVSSHSANILSGIRKKQLRIMKKEDNKAILREFSFNPYGKPVDELLIDFFKLEGLRFREVDEEIERLKKYLYLADYSEEIFLEYLEKLANEIGKDDMDISRLKMAKIKRDKNAKNK
ncbi:MAG: AAA family ATPase [Sulfurovum sp.]